MQEPTRQYTAETLEIPAQAVHTGDFINGVKVADVRSGRKYLYFKDDKGTEFLREVPFDKTITVVRKKETKESIAAIRRYNANWYALRSVEKWEPATPAATQAMAEKVAEGYMVNHSDVYQVISAQARDRAWRGLVEVVTNRKEGEEAIDAAKRFAEYLTSQVLSKMNYGVYRSSSIVSNVMEEAEVSAMASLADEIRRWA